jgi:hypothetical protein
LYDTSTEPLRTTSRIPIDSARSKLASSCS